MENQLRAQSLRQWKYFARKIYATVTRVVCEFQERQVLARHLTKTSFEVNVSGITDKLIAFQCVRYIVGPEAKSEEHSGKLTTHLTLLPHC